MYGAEIGLPQVLVSGGVEYVLATTRVVADKVAQRFVEHFYAAGGAKNPPAAFRRAIAGHGGEDPGFASFRLWGRPRRAY